MKQGRGRTFAVPCELMVLPNEGSQLRRQLCYAGYILYLAVYSACTVRPPCNLFLHCDLQ